MGGSSSAASVPVAPPGPTIVAPEVGAPEVVEIPIDELNLGPSMRDRGIDPAHVATLAEVPASWPPILVNRSDGSIVDGQHRVLAAKQLGLRRVLGVWFDGTPEEGYLEFVRRNVAHGLPLTLVERGRSAVSRREPSPASGRKPVPMPRARTARTIRRDASGATVGFARSTPRRSASRSPKRSSANPTPHSARSRAPSELPRRRCAASGTRCARSRVPHQGTRTRRVSHSQPCERSSPARGRPRSWTRAATTAPSRTERTVSGSSIGSTRPPLSRATSGGTLSPCP